VASNFSRSVDVCAGIVLAFVLIGCSNEQGAPQKGAKGGKGGPAAPSPVVVAQVEKRQVPLEVRAIGNVEAFSAVEVRSQVSGPIVRVLFQEGQDVRQGQPLFEIDPRPFQQAIREAEAEVAARKAAMMQAEANLERDLANAKNARSQADRYQQLTTAGIIAREQNEQMQTSAVASEKGAAATRAAIESARAAIQGAESKVADARLFLSYTTVRAPISGRAGAITKKAGLIAANNETLVTINQITPVFATFSVPEQTLPQLRRFTAAGKLKVLATPQNVAGETPAQGMVDFIDNRVDAATGTILVKARFPNSDRRLWPGQFVNVNVHLTDTSEVVAPTAAVKTAQKGSYVFVVKADSTAEQRIVQTDRAFEDVTIIRAGLEPGERVIVEGQLRVKPGGKVRVTNDRPGGAEKPSGAKQARNGI
jgi:membrane fusion protein, multidrug efflux system